ncbi:hypothetical protein O6H91_04G074900 [Diphasiastrum complanatum]|uniref:Uncharacterized protein n=2 Tax=Diphasiastrum complanatum TaxID=34168 RepID=A0ACC2DYE4_DIPCM|nr:hypothetical protein O6H91_04G074900 [Diphasiastrum complanatum]KAJ7559225.1 hypothetical protein O6H91_04G074900 [Diphasiastrum complanatum]
MESVVNGVSLVLGLVLLFLLSKFIILPKKKLNLPPSPPAWPIIGHLHLLGKLPHRSLAQVAQKCGPLMFLRLGSVLTVVVSSAAMAREFLKTYDQIFASRPRTLAAKILLYNCKGVAFAEMGPYWRDMKKICQLELLTPKQMEVHKHIRLEEAYIMVKSIRDKICEGGEPVDVHSHVFALTRGVITRMVLNKTYFTSESKEALQFKEVLTESFHLHGVPILGDYIPYIGRWLDIQGYEKRMKAAGKQMDAILDKIIQEHQDKQLDLSKGHTPLDFIDVLLSLRSKGDYGYLSMDSIKGVALDMLAAGTETAAVTIEWALSEILLNPSVHRKCQQELDCVIGRERKVEEADLSQLKYLQAIVNETFRLHPTAPFLMPHESTQDVQIAGYDIPAKTRLLVNLRAIGTDPSIWERPLEFCPERFLNTKIDVRGHDFELMPFGTGRRGCPGLLLGLTVVQLGLAVLLQSFEWQLSPSQELDMSEVFGLTVPKSVPLHAIATPRLPQHLYA